MSDQGQQQPPGTIAAMDPRPDHGAPSHRGRPVERARTGVTDRTPSL